jgi:hypothetical protein
VDYLLIANTPGVGEAALAPLIAPSPICTAMRQSTAAAARCSRFDTKFSMSLREAPL